MQRRAFWLALALFITGAAIIVLTAVLTSNQGSSGSATQDFPDLPLDRLSGYAPNGSRFEPRDLTASGQQWEVTILVRNQQQAEMELRASGSDQTQVLDYLNAVEIGFEVVPVTAAQFEPDVNAGQVFLDAVLAFVAEPRRTARQDDIEPTASPTATDKPTSAPTPGRFPSDQSSLRATPIVLVGPDEATATMAAYLTSAPLFTREVFATLEVANVERAVVASTTERPYLEITMGTFFEVCTQLEDACTLRNVITRITDDEAMADAALQAALEALAPSLEENGLLDQRDEFEALFTTWMDEPRMLIFLGSLTSARQSQSTGLEMDLVSAGPNAAPGDYQVNWVIDPPIGAGQVHAYVPVRAMQARTRAIAGQGGVTAYLVRVEPTGYSGYRAHSAGSPVPAFLVSNGHGALATFGAMVFGRQNSSTYTIQGSFTTRQ